MADPQPSTADELMAQGYALLFAATVDEPLLDIRLALDHLDD